MAHGVREIKSGIAASLQTPAEGGAGMPVVDDCGVERCGSASSLRSPARPCIGTVSYLSARATSGGMPKTWGHAHEVLSGLELLLAATTDSEAAERGYVITGDESYLGALSAGGQRSSRTADDALAWAHCGKSR